MKDVLTLSKDRLAWLAEETVVAAGRRDSGEPAAKILCERLTAGHDLFTVDQWKLLQERVGEASAWLQDDVLPAFFDLLDLQDEAAGDEELMDRFDPFMGEGGELLLFLAVLKRALGQHGIRLEAEQTAIPERPPLPDEE
jgi:hypothetical protein